MRGRRLPDCAVDRMPNDRRPGDYWKLLVADEQNIERPMKVQYDNKLTLECWRVVTPLGQVGTLTKHTVREHADGTISVRPKDGSSNSIAVTDHRGVWHGYIEHGEWREV